MTDYNKDLIAVYEQQDLVDQYASADYITPVERFLFEKYFRPADRVLDLGVGGGRTSAILSKDASEYVGVDIAPEMIVACRARFPHLRFETGDAADLGSFDSGHFDLVVFSFNGMGHLQPPERARCLQECNRVLKPGGILIFSLHNARSLFFRIPACRGLESVRPILGSFRQSFARFCSRFFSDYFWKGSGYLRSSTHGDLGVFLTLPYMVRPMLAKQGFSLLEFHGDGYPESQNSLTTRWYYYAARK